MRTEHRKAPGIGSTKRGARSPGYTGLRRIVVAFDEETFAEIRKQAADGQTSFAAQVRLLVEWGLLAAEGGRP